jgi:hypothetical protein
MRKPQKVVVGLVGVLGRILICTVFLAAALGYTAGDVQNFSQVIAAKGSITPACNAVKHFPPASYGV